MDSIILEAANPPVFEWYVKNYGNLFVDRVRSFSANACGGDSRPSRVPGRGASHSDDEAVWRKGVLMLTCA
jgi:hypothetical protein